MKKAVFLLIGFLLATTLCFGTVSDTNSPVKTYTSGATLEYPITFEYLDEEDIEVILYDPDTDTETSQTIDVDYTISDDTVTYTTAPGADYYVILRRITPYTQETDFDTGQAPPLATYENAFDKLTYQTQDLDERVKRAFLLPSSTSISEPTFPDPTYNAGKGLRFNAGGTAIEGYTLGSAVTVNLSKFDDYDDVATMVSEIGATEIHLICDTAVELSEDTTFPATMSIEILKGGSITLGDNNLVINGPFNGHPGCFVQAGTGAVSFGNGAIEAANPEWWTVNTTPGTTDMASAFVYAIASLPSYGKLYAGGYYALGSGISISAAGTRFEINRILYTGGAGSAITIGGGATTVDVISGTINEISQSSQDWDTATIGVRIAGLRFGHINIRKVANFTHAVQIGYVGSGNTYYNTIFIGRTEDAQKHLCFGGDEGEMNGNTIYGPTCYDTGAATNAQYQAGSYGIYIPAAVSYILNGNTFIGSAFNWLTSYRMTSSIYCAGRNNTFISPRLLDSVTSDARVRFTSDSQANIITNCNSDYLVLDDSSLNTVISSCIIRSNNYSVSSTPDYDTDYHTYRPGDIWRNADYDNLSDSPRKICITAGTYWDSTTTTATTTASDATVTLSVPADIYPGIYINIAGVTGPLYVLSRDYLDGTIEVDPVPDASVSAAALTIQEPTWGNESPGILKGTIEWNPGSLVDGAGETSGDITVSGATLGSQVVVGADQNLQGIVCTGYVSSANTVKIRLQNESGGTIDLVNGDWYVKVWKP